MAISKKRLTNLLKEGGIKDIRAFNKWRKNSTDLYNEVRGREATLETKMVDGRIRAVRTALNVKCLIESELGYLCEVGRLFKNNGEFVEQFSPWGLSETRKRGEEALAAVVRGFWQEMRAQVNEAELVHARAPEEIIARDSTVYRGVLSTVFSQYFFLRCKAPLWDDSRPVIDGSVRIYLQWIHPSQMTPEQQIACIMAYAKCFEARVPWNLRLTL